MSEEEEWRKRKGYRNELRSHAQRLDPNLTAYCPKCKKKFQGNHDELVEKMTAHHEEEHGS
jgi:hypothetical protein